MKEGAPATGKRIAWARGRAILTVRHYPAGAATGRPRIVFVGGWASTLFTWRYVLPPLSAQAELFYFESREKPSALISPAGDFSIAAMAEDLAGFLEAQGVAGPTLLVGSSLGATVALEACGRLDCGLAGLVLICPNREMPSRRRLWLAQLVPDGLCPRLRRPLAWTLRCVARDPQLATGLARAVEEADLLRLKRSLAAIRGYEMDLAPLAGIGVPTLVIGASHDKLHRYEDALAICAAIPDSRLKDVRSFASAHSRLAAQTILDFMTHLP